MCPFSLQSVRAYGKPVRTLNSPVILPRAQSEPSEFDIPGRHELTQANLESPSDVFVESARGPFQSSVPSRLCKSKISRTGTSTPSGWTLREPSGIRSFLGTILHFSLDA